MRAPNPTTKTYKSLDDAFAFFNRRLPGKLEGVEFGVIARPIGKRLRRAAPTQLAHKIAIRVENADGRHIGIA